MSRLTLKIEKPVLSPERQALADAITDAGPIRAAADAARIRVEAARGALASAIGIVPVAERAASEARADAVNDPGASRDRLRALRQAVADAVDDVEIAREIANRSEAAFADLNTGSGRRPLQGGEPASPDCPGGGRGISQRRV